MNNHESTIPPEYKEEPIKSVGVLVFNSDKVLLVRHGDTAGHLNDTYGLPAGRLEEGEDEISAAVRELREETGLVTSNDSLEPLANTYFAKIKRKEGEVLMSIKVFRCNNHTGQLTGNSETTPVWVDISDLQTLNLLPNVEKIVKEALE